MFIGRVVVGADEVEFEAGGADAGSVSAMPKKMTLWPRCSTWRARAVMGLMCPVPGKQKTPSLAMVHVRWDEFGPEMDTDGEKSRIYCSAQGATATRRWVVQTVATGGNVAELAVGGLGWLHEKFESS
jgi:hypothetical protein